MRKYYVFMWIITAQLLFCSRVIIAQTNSVELYKLNISKQGKLQYRVVYDYKMFNKKNLFELSVFVELVNSTGKVEDRIHIPFGEGIDGKQPWDTNIKSSVAGESLQDKVPGYNNSKVTFNKSWVEFGFESNNFALQFKKFLLTDHLNALLITLRQGFDHVSYHNLLVTIVDNKLKIIWKRRPQSQPVVYDVSLYQSKNILLYTGVKFNFYGEANTFDLYESQAYKWNAKISKFALYNTKIKTFQVIVKTFKSAKEATEYKNSKRDCLGGFWVRPLVVDTSSTRAILYNEFKRLKQAKQEFQRVKACKLNKELVNTDGYIDFKLKI